MGDVIDMAGERAKRETEVWCQGDVKDIVSLIEGEATGEQIDVIAIWSPASVGGPGNAVGWEITVEQARELVEHLQKLIKELE